MFSRSARYYDALYSWKDYAGEAERLHELIQARLPGARTLLDVACGTGKHLEALAERYDVAGVDLDPALLAIARERLPDVPLHEADMTAFDLGRRFDAVVCLFSAIGYMTTLEDMARALATMRDHMVDGGVLVVEPWFKPADWHDGAVFAEGTEDGDLAVARASRSWREGDVSVIEMHYALARPDRTWSFSEVHRMGLFTTAQQLEVYRGLGFVVEHEYEGLSNRGLFVAVKPQPG